MLCVVIGEGRRCCRRPQNEQICLPQDADVYITMPMAADSIFERAVDLYKNVCRISFSFGKVKIFYAFATARLRQSGTNQT